MTQRGASAAALSAMGQAATGVCHLLELYLDTETVRVTDAWRPVSYGGNTYTALGEWVSFEPIRESTQVEVSSVRVQLSGVDQAMPARILSNDYIDRQLVIRKAFLDANEGLVVDPIPLFDGRCDAPRLVENPDANTSIVEIEAASQWSDFDRRPGRHTNHAEQQVWFPGDLGFEYVSEVNRQIKWGAA